MAKQKKNSLKTHFWRWQADFVLKSKKTLWGVADDNKNRIKIESLNLSVLLADFLSEVLYLTQVNKEVYNDIKFSKFTDTKIKGKLKGKEVEEFGEDIKAVTYHNLDVHQRKDGKWEATVLFDI